MFQKLKKGTNVIHIPTSRKGRVIDVKGAFTVVEFIVGRNLVENTRTTKLEDVLTHELKPYVQEPKKKVTYKPYLDVRDFHKAFGHPVAPVPQAMSLERAEQRADYTVEELVEFLWASTGGDHSLTEEVVDRLVQNIHKAMKKCQDKGKFPEEEILLHQVDAITDANYFNYGTFVELGVNPTKIFSIVQNANMGKLDPVTKQPILHPETKKIMKPEGWEENYQPEPLIRKEIERQIELAKNRQERGL